MQPNNFQQKILASDKKVNLIFAGRGAGTETGMFMSALQKVGDVNFVVPAHDTRDMCEVFVRFLDAVGVAGHTQFSKRTVILDGRVVRFIPDVYSSMKGWGKIHWMIPKAHNLQLNYIDHALLAAACLSYTASALDEESRRRTPVTGNGEILGYHDESWDCAFINWRNPYADRAERSDYHQNIGVITPDERVNRKLSTSYVNSLCKAGYEV